VILLYNTLTKNKDPLRGYGKNNMLPLTRVLCVRQRHEMTPYARGRGLSSLAYYNAHHIIQSVSKVFIRLRTDIVR